MDKELEAHLQSREIGWAGDISREESERLLTGQPLGTFLFRWSPHANSYVLSYVGQDRIFHIKDIFNHEGRIKVLRDVGAALYFDFLLDYVNAMKEMNLIKNPLDPSTSHHKEDYGTWKT